MHFKQTFLMTSCSEVFQSMRCYEFEPMLGRIYMCCEECFLEDEKWGNVSVVSLATTHPTIKYVCLEEI